MHCVAFLRFWASVKDKDIHTVFSIQKSIAQSGGKKKCFFQKVQKIKKQHELKCRAVFMKVFTSVRALPGRRMKRRLPEAR